MERIIKKSPHPPFFKGGGLGFPFAKGGKHYLLPLAKGGGEGFYKDFHTTNKMLQNIF